MSEQKVKLVVARIFGVPIEDIDDNTSPDTLENWDSLQHINLVSALEEEFEIRFTDEEILEMLTVGLIIYIVNAKNLNPND